MLWEVNLSVPKDNAAASVPDVEDVEWGEELLVLDGTGELPEPNDPDGCAFLETCRFICSAFASAFSWVRTK
jgi:hypothetical protein